MKFCEKCGGPLRPDHCRLCWMDTIEAYRPLGTQYQPPRPYLVDDCNSTDDTDATSTWLPRHAFFRAGGAPWCMRIDDDSLYYRWLSLLARDDDGFGEAEQATAEGWR